MSPSSFGISVSSLAVIMAFHTQLVTTETWSEGITQLFLRTAAPPTNGTAGGTLLVFPETQLCLAYCWEALVPFEKLSSFSPLSKLRPWGLGEYSDV